MQKGQIAPAEIELALRSCRDVGRCRVVGLPDDRLGEEVGAAVVLKDGADISADTLRAQADAPIIRIEDPLTGIPYWAVLYREHVDYIAKHPEIFSSFCISVSQSFMTSIASADPIFDYASTTR